MKLFKNIFERPAAFLEYIACALLAVCALITLANVVMRLVFRSPVYGAVEMIQYGVLLAVCFGLPSCTMHGGHARVTLVADALPRTAKAVLSAAVDVVSITLFSVISYKLFGSVASVLKNGRTTEVFKVPYQFVYYAIIAGLILMVLVLIYCMVCEFIRLKDEPSGVPADKTAE